MYRLRLSLLRLRSRLSSGRFWARALSISSLCVLILLPWQSYAANNADLLTSIESRLSNILLYSQKLESERETSALISTQQRQTISELQSELSSLSEELRNSLTSSKAAQLRAQELMSSLTELQTKLDQLSRNYESLERVSARGISSLGTVTVQRNVLIGIGIAEAVVIAVLVALLAVR